MKENRIRRGDDHTPPPKRARPSLRPKVRLSLRPGRISLLGLMQRNLVFAAFLTLIGLAYIWSSHLAERHARQVDRLSEEVKELESEYNTLNAQLSRIRKQSTLVGQMDSLGLQRPEEPPIQLEVKSHE
ncbi:MAG: hypothetical protein LW884_08075 [Bacteroidetes bacterium]|jgi:hypothetical protein|nr:hypothetical protein [Bacteroidota bacterium]